MFYGGEVGWRVICAYAAFVVSEDHVHNPVQAVLDGPVAANDGADFSAAFDDDHALQSRPNMALLQPVDVMDDGDCPGFDATMIAIDRFVPAHCRILERAGFLLPDEEFDVLMQRSLVALEGQNVIGLLVDDLFGDGALAADGIDADNGAFDRKHLQQLGDSDDLIGLIGDLDLAEDKALAGRKSRHHVNGGLCPFGAAQGFAVDGDNLHGHARQRGNPGDKTALEGLGIECRQDIAKMVVRRCAVVKGPKAAQKVKLPFAEQGDIDEGLGAGQNRQQAQKQHFRQRVHHLAGLTGIRQILKISQKNNRFLIGTDIQTAISHPNRSVSNQSFRQIQQFNALSPTRPDMLTAVSPDKP